MLSNSEERRLGSGLNSRLHIGIKVRIEYHVPDWTLASLGAVPGVHYGLHF